MAFFFHWAATDADWLAVSAWNPAYAVNDEDVLSLRIQHEEGQIPSLTVQIRNPKVGLLNPSRKTWVWISWDGPGYVEPLFFGRLVGIPSDLLGEAVTLQLTAKPKTYVTDKQIAAEALKVRPYYDPVFIDVAKRDDPDAILEGYSALWHVDRVTQKVSASDVLIGEDGTAIFLPGEVPYDSVELSLNQSPLIAVAVKAAVSWTQDFKGYIETETDTINTYSGDGIIADWPQPASSLGAGWTVVSSFVKDLNRIANVQNIQYGVTWNNNQRSHKDGDVMSYSVRRDYPNFSQATKYITRQITRQSVVGVLDKNTKDIYGNPSPTNIPASLNWTAEYVPQWRVKYRLGLRYDANRARTERIEFILKGDAQPILSDPLVTQNTDVIEVNGADVGQPIINFRNWTSVAGRYVALGTFVFPDNPLVAGQKSIQVCVVAGVAGTTIPTFSNVAGETTVDGGVTWASLGYASNIYNITTDWQKNSLIPLGEIILPHVPFSINYKDYVTPGRMQDPEVGVSVDKDFIVEVPNKGFFQCILAGVTGNKNPKWKVPGVTKDGTVEWVFIGTALASGTDYYICTQSGTTGDYLPEFGGSPNIVNDNNVVWTKIAATEVPIGGAPGMIGRNDYFPTDRGNWSIEYLLCLARARLRMRSRAVEIGFVCKFERATKLSCRMNATIYDPRLPGGVATGKIISYELIAEGDDGSIYAKVRIGCAVGYNNTLSLITGDPVYVEDDYVEAAYQEHDGSQNPVDDDIGYTPPASNVTDKFIFPLTPDQVFLNGGIQQRGSIHKQAKAIESALNSAWLAANLAPKTIDSVNDSLAAQELAQKAANNSVANALQKNPMWLELELLPVSGISYDNFYSLETTDLMLPKMIDLEATTTASPPSTGHSILYASADFIGVSGGRAIGSVPFGHAGAIMSGESSIEAKTLSDPHARASAAGAGALGARATVIHAVRHAMVPAAAMVARASPRRVTSGAVAGTGSMTTIASVRSTNNAASFAGAGGLVSRARMRNVAVAALTGEGTLGLTERLRLAAQATFAGDSTMNLSDGSITGSASFAGEGSMSATVAPQEGAASFSGEGSMGTTVGTLGSVDLAGEGSMEAITSVIAAASYTGAGVGVMQAVTIAALASSSLSGAGTMLVDATIPTGGTDASAGVNGAGAMAVIARSNFAAYGSASDTSNISSHTYTAVNIGPESDNRLVVVVVGAFASSGGSARTINSATIGGISATVNATVGNGTARTSCHIISAVVPTGTTADIVINFNSLTGTSTAIQVYSGTPASTSPIGVTSAGGGSTGSVSSRSVTATKRRGGFYIVAAAHAGNVTLSGATSGSETLNENMDIRPSGGAPAYAAYSSTTDEDSTSTVTVTPSSSGAMCVCCATFQ